MSKSIIWTIIVIAIIIVLAIIYWMYANNAYLNTPTTFENDIGAQDSVRTGSNLALGSFLTDKDGKALYYFANDVAGKSNCTGQCLSSWPPFYAPNVTVSGALNAGDFGKITNSSGVGQTTYKGWPLYYYSGDKNPGETNGQGLQNSWFVAASPFYNIIVLNNSKFGSYLANDKGLALYYNRQDTKGSPTSDPKNSCSGECLSTWPVFDQAKVIAPKLLKAEDFKEFIGSDGQTQLSYKGYPLYTYSEDLNSGDAKGDALESKWYLVKP